MALILTGTTKIPRYEDSHSYFISLPEEETWYEGMESWEPRQPSLQNPIWYRGWQICQWTGWKGNWAVRNPLSTRKQFCHGCGKLIECGDILYYCQSVDWMYHAECQTKYHGRITSQWVAMESSKGDRFAYASVPGDQGLFNKGGCFNIREEIDQPTYYTDPEVLMELRAECFERLKGVIDVNP